MADNAALLLAAATIYAAMYTTDRTRNPVEQADQMRRAVAQARKLAKMVGDREGK